MNGNKNDTNYRYTMPVFNITIAGKLTGIHTIINNIDDISRSINHPPEVIMKYIATVTGSNYIRARETITGPHTVEEFNDIIIEYIKYLVFCQKCFIPETVPSLSGNKKNPKLEFCCSGCKTTLFAPVPNKRIEKGIEIIIKYLKTESEWKMQKGTTVKQDNQSTTNNIDNTDNTSQLTNNIDNTDNTAQLTNNINNTDNKAQLTNNIDNTDNISKPLRTDYFEILKDDIRNIRILNSTQTNYIKTLSHEQKNEVLDIYNSCIKFFNEYVALN